MRDIVTALTEVVIALFAVSSMLSVGLANRLMAVIRPLRWIQMVARILVANFVLVPAVVLLLTWLIPIATPLRYGLILVSLGAGAPFFIKLSSTAGASLRLTASMLLLLLPTTIIVMPLAVPLLLPGAEASPLAIATPLVLTMLLPLAVGLVVREQRPDLARRLQPVMSKIATVSLLALVIGTVAANLDAIVRVGWRAALVALLTVLFAFTVGYLLGGLDPDNREVVGLGTGQRNIAAATVVASQSIGLPETVVMVVVTSLIGLAVLFPIARILWQREYARHPG